MAAPKFQYESTVDKAPLRVAAGAQLVQVFTGTVARTDTSAKTLFTLPAGATVITTMVHSPVASNAGTTALLTVGSVADPDRYIDDLSLLTVTGWFVPNSNAANGTAVVAANATEAVGTTDLTVVGTYAESGSASNTGGPWTVWMFCTVSPFA